MTVVHCSKIRAFRANREESEELVAIGKDIVRKCVGSTLAIKTMASLLRDESQVVLDLNKLKNKLLKFRV